MKQLRQVQISNLLFIDTETARLQKDLKEGSPDYLAWEFMIKKQLRKGEIEDIKADYYERSALYAEYSRLVCISVGRIKDGKLVITSYKDSSEKELLERFMSDLDIFLKHRPEARLVGHSVKGFDIPFIFRRCLVNQVIPNSLIDIAGLKPWEVTALDTKELWKASGYYNSSLVALCLALNIPSPKNDISGADVSEVYYNEGEAGLARISEYCERDVMAVANVVKRCRFEPIFDSYEPQEPKERKELGLMDRIGKAGAISERDKEELLRKAEGATIEKKEKIIKMLKASLIVAGKSLSEDLELAILSA